MFCLFISFLFCSAAILYYAGLLVIVCFKCAFALCTIAVSFNDMHKEALVKLIENYVYTSQTPCSNRTNTINAESNKEPKALSSL
jgi:hypothetical protein